MGIVIKKFSQEQDVCFQNYSDILGNNTKAVRNCKELYKDQNEL